MKGDLELCMAAVAQNWRSLAVTSEEMKGDRELCTAAVAQHWQAFEYASNDLQTDETFAIAAVRSHLEIYPNDKGKIYALKSAGAQGPDATGLLGVWEYLPESMKENAHVRREAGLAV